MLDPFLGQIEMFGGNFPPRGFALCQGQVLPIAQYTALFSLLGTTYGGNGQTTFALPDLRGRLPLHQGQGAGLTPRTIGEVAGVESVTLLTTQLPAHSHALIASTATATQSSPANAVPAAVSQTPGSAVGSLYFVPGTQSASQVAMQPTTVGTQGGTQPHPNMMPTLAVNFIIALEGIYPSRN